MMKKIEVKIDKKLRKKPPYGRFRYEFLQVNPITKEEKWIKSGLVGATYLVTVLSSYVKQFLKHDFKGVRNVILEVPLGYKEKTERQIRLMEEAI